MGSQALKEIGVLRNSAVFFYVGGDVFLGD
jgi:hypothetical protein